MQKNVLIVLTSNDQLGETGKKTGPPLWDLVSDADSIEMIEATWAADKPVATVCHAGAVLANVRDAEGNFIVQGREVTGFSNAEEAEYGTTDVVPLLVEDTVKERGGRYVRGENWVPFTRQDGRLITGQNPASSEAVAKLLLSALEA